MKCALWLIFHKISVRKISLSFPPFFLHLFVSPHLFPHSTHCQLSFMHFHVVKINPNVILYNQSNVLMCLDNQQTFFTTDIVTFHSRNYYNNC